jgi:hypothetical protein
MTMYHAALYLRGRRVTEPQPVAPTFTRVDLDRDVEFDELRVTDPAGDVALTVGVGPMLSRRAVAGDWVEVAPTTTWVDR